MKSTLYQIFCSLAAWSFVFPAPSFAQGAPITAAYNRLRLFNSKVDSGISYVNFRSEWGDVRGLIDIAIQDGKPSELTQKLDEIRTTYLEATQFWYCLIEVRYLVLVKLCLGDRPPSSSPILGPGLAKIINEAGSSLETRHVVSGLVPLYFKLADAQTQQLGALLRNR